MRETYALTVLLYSDRPCHMLDLVAHLQEFIKYRVKSECNRLNGKLISTFCVNHNITGIEELKDLRDAYVHHLNEFERVGVALSGVSADDIMSTLRYFNVACSKEYVESEIRKELANVEYWCSNIGEV